MFSRCPEYVLQDKDTTSIDAKEIKWRAAAKRVDRLANSVVLFRIA